MGSLYPLPNNPGVQGGSFPTITGYFISHDTPYRQECWQWIKFLTTFDVNLGMPARRSVAESAAYRQRVGDEVASANLASIDQMKTTFIPAANSGWMGVGYRWFTRAVAQIALDDVPVEEALTTAQEMFEAYRNCIIDRDAFQDANVQQECVREVDPTMPDF